MLLGFGYLYKFAMFYYFFQKAENNIFKKTSWPKFCNLLLLYFVFIA